MSGELAESVFVSLSRWAGLAVMGGALALSGCGKQEAAATPAVPSSVVAVVVRPAVTLELTRKVHVVGSLLPLERATVSNRVAGLVKEMRVDLGDRVPAGAKLAQIEPDRFQLAVQQSEQILQETLAKLGLKEIPPASFNVDETAPVKQALSELDAAKLKFNRAEPLHKQQLMRDFEYLDIESGLRIAESGLQVARDQARSLLAAARQNRVAIDLRMQDLRDTTITAPDGQTPGRPPVTEYSIAERHVSAGEYLREGTVLFTLVADNTLRLQARVPERYLAAVRAGQNLRFAVEAYPGESFSGLLTALDPTVDPTSRTFVVEALVDNAKHRLRPGSFVQGDILTDTEKAVMAPVSAVTSFAGVSKIFVLDDSHTPLQVRQLVVRPGQQEEQLVEIPTGLKAGESIVVSGQSKLYDGSAVRIVAPATTETAPAPASRRAD